MKVSAWILITAIIFTGCSTMEQTFKPQSYPCVIGCGNEGFTPDPFSLPFSAINGINEMVGDHSNADSKNTKEADTYGKEGLNHGI